LDCRSKAINLHLNSVSIEKDDTPEEAVQGVSCFPKHATLKTLHVSVTDLNATVKALLCSQAARARVRFVDTIILEVRDRSTAAVIEGVMWGSVGRWIGTLRPELC